MSNVTRRTVGWIVGRREGQRVVIDWSGEVMDTREFATLDLADARADHPTADWRIYEVTEVDS